ncbi:MAG: DNA repair exonuclease [Thermoguttaceae bacterium]|nr:DNA repair exonuclease [Thermoguttaceae bacterium]
MSHAPFRFIHAADFHLERPVAGVAELPDGLRQAFLDAGYSAAQRVFDAALAEEVDFVVLSGDLLEPQLTGPRGPLFLADQFARVTQRGIPIYWAGGRVDPPENWPAAIHLPEGVHRFPVGRAQGFIYTREETALVRVTGVSRTAGRGIRVGDFDPDPEGLFTVAVAHGTSESDAMKARGIHYWALGGSHTRHTLFSTPQVAHYPGSPQGRRPEEHGPHGATLVQVDAQRNVRLTLVPTDAVRFHQERLSIEQPTTRDALAALLRERLRTIAETMPGMEVFVSWTVAGSGPLLTELRRTSLARDLLAELHRDRNADQAGIWSLSLRPESPPVLPPEAYEQQTIAGDFLRAVRHYQMNPADPLDLKSCLSESQQASPVAGVARADDRALREQVLREAAILGSDLLGGEESQS